MRDDEEANVGVDPVRGVRPDGGEIGVLHPALLQLVIQTELQICDKIITLSFVLEASGYESLFVGRAAESGEADTRIRHRGRDSSHP